MWTTVGNPEHAFAEGQRQTKAALAADPINEGHLLAAELIEASLELFDSKNGG